MTVSVVQFTVKGAAATFDRSRPYTLVYDGACRMCGKLVRTIQRLDRDEQIEAVASQAPGVRERFHWIPAQAYLESVQLIAPDDTTWQGAAAVERTLDILPRGAFITWIFSIPGIRPLAEKVYRWVARNRYKLGCGEHCVYRTPAADGSNRTKGKQSS